MKGEARNMRDNKSTGTATVQAFHAMEIDHALREVEAKSSGLSSHEAELRLARFGHNQLPKKKQTSPFVRFLVHFHNVLIYILLAAAVITAFLGEWVDTAVIVSVVVINAIIGFVQEGKAEKALDAVRRMLSVTANCRRDGQFMHIGAENIVPGDIVSLKAGDRIPADVRMIEVNNLQTDEASLTGESLPVAKQVSPNPPEVGVGDRTCLAYSGTLVTAGRGIGVVVGTGANTELGRINAMLSEISKLTTPLLRRIKQFGEWLTVIILVVGAAVFAIGVFYNEIEYHEMFLAAVGLIVAAIPEGLPAIITITLAIGVQRMAQRKAIIRKLPAVETLGSVSVICSDKTGTLTRSEMTVSKVILAHTRLDVSGSGYVPQGEFSLPSESTAVSISGDEFVGLRRLFAAAALCNDSRVYEKDEQWILEGEPTEGALLVLAAKGQVDLGKVNQECPRLKTIPFDSDKKFMATLNKVDGDDIIFVKGAPDRLFSLCRFTLDNNESVPFDSSFWDKKTEELATQGFRVLALAQAKVTASDSQEPLPQDLSGISLTLLGVVGIIDPPRSEAITAIKTCREAGIVVKMITGDHALTARSIAESMNLTHSNRVVTGQEIDAMSLDELVQAAIQSDVFARVSPEHKLKLVQALQSRGMIVAMTGDGVNDSPALKQADVGVAMGIKGTEAAKEAAEMVLADDNFASIASAVEEGRTVYDNIKKSILFIIPTNGGEAIVILLAIVFGLVLPITPLQILWVNMITAVTLGLAMAFEPMEKGVMTRPPRLSSEPLISRYYLWRILFVSALLTINCMGIFLWLMSLDYDVEYARTAAVNMLVMGEIVYLFNARRERQSSINRTGMLATPYVWMAVAATMVAQMVFTYTPIFQFWFRTQPIELWVWTVVVGMSVMLFLLVELEKVVVRMMRKG